MTARQMKELEKVYTRTLVSLYRALDQCTDAQKSELMVTGMRMYLARSSRPVLVSEAEIRNYVAEQMGRTA